jgi:O-6-methylguanine DNA methyltransferase
MRHDDGLIIVETAMGWLGVAASEQGICRIVLPKTQKQGVQKELETCLGANCTGKKRKSPLYPALTKGKMGGFERAARRATDILRKYFSGERVLFDLPLDMRYYTRFQKAVWQATAGIPYGETRSYAWVAKKIGNPRAVRAVGQALGANPVPIIIPCHRVIGSSGKLCGFAGGLTMKKGLLELEKNQTAHHRGRGERVEK